MKKRVRTPEPGYLRVLARLTKQIRMVADEIEGVSYKQLAAWAGLGPQTVSKFLQGKTVWPEARTLILMAKAVQADINVEVAIKQARRGA